MKRSTYIGTLVAATLAGYVGSASAQQGCEQEIQQLSERLQQVQLSDESAHEIWQLLARAKEAGPGGCDSLVSTARERLHAQSGGQVPVSGAAQSGRQSQMPTTPSDSSQPSTSTSTSSTQPSSSQAQEWTDESVDSQAREWTEDRIDENQTQTWPQQSSDRQSSTSDMSQSREQTATSAQPAEMGVTRQPAQSAQSSQATQVEIQQQPAQVDVDAGSPEVTVQERPAQVTVEQQSPEVTITQPEPEVTVQQAEPQVTVNQGTPEVQVRQAEPQVRVEQAEQPDVRVVQEGDEQAQRAMPAQSAAQTAAERDVQQQQRQQSAITEQSGISEPQASELVGKTARTTGGEEVGEVSAVVKSRADGQLHAVIDVGGFFGIGQRAVAVPLERARVSEDIVITEITRQQLEQMPDYDEQRYVAVGE